MYFSFRSAISGCGRTAFIILEREGAREGEEGTDGGSEGGILGPPPPPFPPKKSATTSALSFLQLPSGVPNPT